MNNYTRNCVTCNKILIYSSYKNLWRANSNNASCVDCTRKIPKKSKQPIFSTVCVTCNKLILYSSMETLRKSKSVNCQSCLQKPLSTGRTHTNESKQKISKNHAKYWMGKKRPMSDESKNKIRLSTIDFIKRNKGQCAPRYNPAACQIFNEINEEFGLFGKHAENGGEFYIKELGYWLDYYEPTLNLVIEYDELAHSRKEKKDMERQNQIETLLKCKFVRIKETDDTQSIITKIKEVVL